MRTDIRLEEILQLQTKKELEDMAVRKAIPDYSKLNKEELIQKLCQYILNPSTIGLKVLVSTQSEIEWLKKNLEKEAFELDDYDNVDYWQDIGFVYVTMDNKVHIPVEIKKILLELREDREKNIRKNRTNIISQYAMACTNLYNVVDLDMFIEILKEQMELIIDEDEIIWWCTIRENYRKYPMYYFREGYIISENYSKILSDDREEFRDILEIQADKPYYIPNKEELLAYTDLCYIDRNSAYIDMVEFLCENLKITVEEAEIYCSDMQLLIRDGSIPSEVVNECIKNGLEFLEEEHINSFMIRFEGFYNHTRMPENRGYTPFEIKNGIHIEGIL